MEHGKELCDTRAISNEAALIFRDVARNIVVEIVVYTALSVDLAYDAGWTTVKFDDSSQQVLSMPFCDQVLR